MVLFWDFDMTLASRPGAWLDSVLQLMEENGFPSLSASDVRPLLYSGFPWHNAQISHSDFFNGMAWWARMEIHFKAVFIDLGASEELACELSKKVREKYLHLRPWDLYEDTIETLEIVKEMGYKNYLLSNHVPELKFIVDRTGISGYFEKIYNSAYIGYEKPHPEFFNYVIKDTGIDIKEVVMIGDNYTADILGANALGIKAILVHGDNEHKYSLYSKDLKGVIAHL